MVDGGDRRHIIFLDREDVLNLAAKVDLARPWVSTAPFCPSCLNRRMTALPRVIAALSSLAHHSDARDFSLRSATTAWQLRSARWSLFRHSSPGGMPSCLSASRKERLIAACLESSGHLPRRVFVRAAMSDENCAHAQVPDVTQELTRVKATRRSGPDPTAHRSVVGSSQPEHRLWSSTNRPQSISVVKIFTSRELRTMTIARD